MVKNRQKRLHYTHVIHTKLFRFVLYALLTLPITMNSYSSPQLNTHEYRLANGLKLIVREDRRSPVAIFQIWYRVGSSYEPTGKTGISHLLEHMMFSDTPHLEAGELSRLVSEYGGEENAFTSSDYTGYYQIWEKSRIPMSFELEAGRMAGLQMTKEFFNTEINVVMEERRLRVDDNPSAVAHERFLTTAYISSPYQQPVIGWMHDLEHLTLQDTQQWYDQWYTPNNAIIVVVGDVEPTEMFELAERYFGHIPARDIPKAPIAKDVPPLGERRMTIKVKVQLPSIRMAFNVPTIGTAEEHQDVYALLMLAWVLDGGYSARIETDLIRGSKLAASASASYQLYSRGDGLFEIRATPNQETSLDTLENAILEIIEDLKTNPPKIDELNRVKAQIISNIVYKEDSIRGQARNIGILESMGLSWKLLGEELTELKKIQPEQISDIAKRYLTSDRLTIAHIIPRLDKPHVQ